jgi:hypothetical protein
MFELSTAFYYFMNFFYIVSKKKSNKINRMRARVMRKLSRQIFIFYEPILANIIYEGYGASTIIIELLEPPKHYPK